MTTIVYRDEVMAADGRGYGGSAYDSSVGAKRKVWRLRDGSLLGCSSGYCGAGEALRDWIDTGAFPLDAPAFEKFVLLLVRPDGGVFYYRNGPWPSGPVTADYHAVGSGADVALGALWSGNGAAVAVRAACAHDPMSGPPITTLRLGAPENDAEYR